MYAKFCGIEILSSYIKEISVGDMLTVQALVTNPLDWQHFYEKLSSIREGERTDFMVVTSEGDRLQGYGDVVEAGRWSIQGQYGFKIKIRVRRQKSLSNRRTRTPKKQPVKPVTEIQPPPSTARASPEFSLADAIKFKELMKGSLTMDIAR